MQSHLPWFTAPFGFRPADCNRADQFPAFITFQSGATPVATFTHDFQCNAALYVNGCGLEQPLEALHRALLWYDPRDRPGNTSPNAGFVRDDALLAIVVLTDEEDGSARDCRFAAPGEPCADATSVYQTAQGPWSTDNRNMRFYLYHPAGGPQDPTWPLDRYVDPADPTRALWGLKPGHPERVLFAAITGVPIRTPPRPDGGTDWDRLLGTPDATDPNDFDRRDDSTAIAEMSPEGPISMRLANIDPDCPSGTRLRVVPACRREGTTYNPTHPPCSYDEQYYALPSRRVVEIARRFDQAPVCDGAPCRNGFVGSICTLDLAAPVGTLMDRVLSRLPPSRCVPRELVPVTMPGTGRRTVSCDLLESMPVGEACDFARMRQPLRDDLGRPVFEPSPEGARALCVVPQAPTEASGGPVAGAAGWFYDTTPMAGRCPQRVLFTMGMEPASATRTRLECDQSAVR
jgi:hypothetical protein